MDPVALFMVATLGGTCAIALASVVVSLRKRVPRKELAKQLGPAYLIIEASSSRIAVRVQRDARVYEAKVALSGGESTWFVTSPRPPGHSPWEARAAVPGLRDELERIMVRGRAARLTFVGGELTVGVMRGVSAVDIDEVIDVAAELAAVIDRELPSAVEMDVDASLFAHEPREAVSGTSGAPFGIGTGDRS